MGIFGKPYHIPSQRKGLVGFLQDVLQITSLKNEDRNSKPESSSSTSDQSSCVSSVNQRKLDRVDYFDKLASQAWDKAMKTKTPEEYDKYKNIAYQHEQEAQDIDDSIK